MKSLELLIEKVILLSRWILVIFYLGLAIALLVYGVSFTMKLWSFMLAAPTMGDTDVLLAVLALIDSALVASLIVMVIITGYENFVGNFDKTPEDISWLGKVDMSSLKIKVASTIVAIASIHLLQVFLNISYYKPEQVTQLTIMYGTFVLSALILGLLDWVTAKK